MRATGTNDTTLVVAAQAGDRRALDDLVTAALPLVYTIVRRALHGHPDADDVVQETMLRVLRELPELRSPDSFRPWLAAITVRQVGTHLQRRRLAGGRTAALDDLVEAPDAGAEVANLASLRLDLSGQRRQAVRASGWLDPDDRTLLSLWWLEVAGQLSRTELASALGVSVAHAGVRVQRMHAQLELTRALVAALEVRPRCARLDAALASWDGAPSPLWRKRIARHTRSCARCAGAAAHLVPAERLLVGLGLLAVPVALTAGVLGKIALGGAAAGTASAAALSGTAAGAGAKVGLLSQLAQAIGAHPIVATIVAGTVVAGATVTTVTWPNSPPPAPTVVAGPSTAAPVPSPASTRPTATTSPPTPARSLAPGAASLESVNQAGMFAATTDTYGVLIAAGTGSSSQTRQQATFEVVTGLNDAACFSFRLPDGKYLRHSSWRLRVNANDGTKLFRGDATFCVRPGSLSGSISLESSNYPGWFLRHRGTELWVDQSDGSAGFRADSSFRVRPPL